MSKFNPTLHTVGISVVSFLVGSTVTFYFTRQRKGNTDETNDDLPPLVSVEGEPTEDN